MVLILTTKNMQDKIRQPTNLCLFIFSK